MIILIGLLRAKGGNWMFFDPLKEALVCYTYKVIISSSQSYMGHCIRTVFENNSGRGKSSSILCQILTQWKIYTSSYTGQVRRVCVLSLFYCVCLWSMPLKVLSDTSKICGTVVLNMLYPIMFINARNYCRCTNVICSLVIDAMQYVQHCVCVCLLIDTVWFISLSLTVL